MRKLLDLRRSVQPGAGRQGDLQETLMSELAEMEQAIQSAAAKIGASHEIKYLHTFKTPSWMTSSNRF